MLKTKFNDKIELDIYISEQKIRKEKGYLTHSERQTLEELIKNPKKHIIEEKENPYIKKIVTNIVELRKPCQPITKEDNIDEILKYLKETLNFVGGLGISANQIGIDRRISYCKIPKFNQKTKKLEFNEILLINPKIIEKDRKIVYKNEQCLSLPGLMIDTDRYVFITIENHDKNLNKKMFMAQDLESFCIQHETAHLKGRTIIDDKHRKK